MKKKYVIYVEDAEVSRKVTDSLFRAGFTACTGDKSIDWSKPYVFNSFIVVNVDLCGFYFIALDEIFVRDGTQAYPVEDWGSLVKYSAGSIISDPFQLDGATKPEKTHVIDGKEISESTIKTALSQLFNE